MTPYERTLHEKLIRATKLEHRLTKRANGQYFPELLDLQRLIQEIDVKNRQVDQHLQRYESMASNRWTLAKGSAEAIDQITDELWADARLQFVRGSVAYDLVRILYKKIKSMPLPVFPINRRKPVQWYDVFLFEDSFALLGNYFSWFLSVLQTVGFLPVKKKRAFSLLLEFSSQYITLSQQVRQKAEQLRQVESEQAELYAQLRLTSTAVNKRLMALKQSEADTVRENSG